METNQLKELIQIRQSLAGGGGGSGGNTPFAPRFYRVTTSGAVVSGAKYVSIAVLSGSGSILGTQVDNTFSEIELPYLASGYYEHISYTLNVGSEFAILEIRETSILE